MSQAEHGVYTGTLYIIAAPSGAGKTSLVKSLIESDQDIVVSISHTTRAKRPEEEDGINYYFVNRQEFEALITRNAFLEYAEVFSNLYGTSREWVETQLKQGVDVILEIDWQGAQKVKKQFSKYVSIFIIPPTRDSLRHRLVKRAQDNEEIIEQRMVRAAAELSHYHEFDYLVVNDVFEHALFDLRTIIRAQRLLLQKQQHKQRYLLQNLLAEDKKNV